MILSNFKSVFQATINSGNTANANSSANFPQLTIEDSVLPEHGNLDPRIQNHETATSFTLSFPGQSGTGPPRGEFPLAVALAAATGNIPSTSSGPLNPQYANVLQQQQQQQQALAAAQGLEGLTGQNMNALQQYVMLMNQQQQEASIQQQQPPQTPMSANALLFNALNRGDQQQQQLALAGEFPS